MRVRGLKLGLYLAPILMGVVGDELYHSSLSAYKKYGDGSMQTVNALAEGSSDVLVCHCGDRRLQRRFNEWIEHKFDSWPYRVSVAGCAGPCESEAATMAVVDEVTKFAEIAHIKVVHLINHRDCKAHGGSAVHMSTQAEQDYHLASLVQAAGMIADRCPHLKVYLYFAELDGTIELIFEREGASAQTRVAFPH